MPSHNPGRNRSVDVAVPPFLGEFIAKLSRATQWNRHGEVVCTDGSVRPGAFSGEWVCDDPARFAVDYLWEELLSKYDDGKPSQEKKDVTWQRFKAAEEACAKTNQRFLHPPTSWYSTKTTGVVSLLERTRQKIGEVLGRFDWFECVDLGEFTSGASFALPRKYGQPVYKYSGDPETTFDNLSAARTLICEVPLWKERLTKGQSKGLKIVPGNKVTCVAKNYKADRTIAIEPRLNMYFQKGIGKMIRKRLRKAGVELSTQHVNQDMARIGSLTGMFATIDMKMASDTVALELVRYLLPPDWVAALEQCRSAIGVLPSGEKVYYRKFSSMGNGATFELESLIFWALACAVCDVYGASESFVMIHGDDLIVPTSVAEPTLALLRECGFQPNDDKTFIDGPFRESCGKHYLAGGDVTPFYVKCEPTTLSDLFLLHNKLYRWMERTKWCLGHLYDGCREVLLWLRSLAPSNWRRPRIPNGLGDGAFIGTFDECLPSRPVHMSYLKPGDDHYGWEGWWVDVLIEQAEALSIHDGRLVYADNKWKHTDTSSVEQRKLPKWFKQKPPDETGWLLRAIEPRGLRQDSLIPDAANEGGLTMAPRYKVVRTLVPHFDWPHGQHSSSAGGCAA